jgi:hypothetical protein
MLLHGRYPPEGSPTFQAAMMSTPDEATLLGHITRSLLRDLKEMDFADTVIMLNHIRDNDFAVSEAILH